MVQAFISPSGVGVLDLLPRRTSKPPAACFIVNRDGMTQMHCRYNEILTLIMLFVGELSLAAAQAVRYIGGLSRA